MSANGWLALDLNDAGIGVWGSQGPVLPASPGYAVCDGEGLVTGRAAWERSRISPRRTHHRFWGELDDGALPRAFPRRWTRADLVYRHLADLRADLGAELAAEPAGVIAVVPGDLEPERLGLFLGIAAAAGWPVAGMVDGALAAGWTAGLEPPGAWVLDVGLHRAILTELAAGHGLERRRVLVEPGAGRVALERLWARAAAADFVRATRFDPLHSGASEQNLLLALEGWLDRLLEEERIEARLDWRGNPRSIELTRARVAEAADEIFARICRLPVDAVGAGPGELLLSARAARLPGLLERLERRAELAVRVLPADAAPAAALAARGAIASNEEAPPLVVRLAGRSGGAA